MIWAIRKGEKVKAKPKLKGFCPICKEQLIPKCGLIKRWHWSHKARKDCDNWYEPESEWHINWKNEYPKEQQEVVIGKHRADIKTPLRIIELQNSSISTEEINERENFYGEMVWLLNRKTLCNGLILKRKIEVTTKQKNLYGENIKSRGLPKQFWTFRWKHPKKSWWNAKKPIYIDLGYIEMSNLNYKSNFIFLIKKIYHNIPCGGWGILIKKEEFLKGK